MSPGELRKNPAAAFELPAGDAVAKVAAAEAIQTGVNKNVSWETAQIRCVQTMAAVAVEVTCKYVENRMVHLEHGLTWSNKLYKDL